MKRLSWLTRIERAEKRGKFTKTDYRLAESFTTCAIGEKYSGNFPVLNAYQPNNPLHQAYMHGMHFFDAVQTDNLPEARCLYELIQSLPIEKVEQNG